MRIKALYDVLKTAELRLADFILNHPEDVSRSTIHELQDKSGSSYSTIIRFCKRAGYEGYKEFKNSLLQDIRAQKISPKPEINRLIEGHDTVETIIDKSFDTSFKTLEETRSILDTSSLNKAGDRILAAREVVFIGTGVSGVSAYYAFTRFFRIGLPCSSETDPTLYKLKAAILDKSDVLFAISSSGRSANVVDAARIARERGAMIISLCDFAITPLAQTSHINLYTTPRNVTLFLDLEMPLIIGQINIIDILFFVCCQKMGTKSIDMINMTKRTADREKVYK